MPIDIKPHAYDPYASPELFEGVLARRVVAFVIDFVLIAVPVLLAAMFIFAFGIVTLGLGFALYWLLPPATVVWALVYFGATLGAPASATIGMRVMDLEMRTWHGGDQQRPPRRHAAAGTLRGGAGIMGFDVEHGARDAFSESGDDILA